MGSQKKALPSSKGFGLVETLLVLGAIGALSLGIYMVLSPATAIAQAKTEQDNLRQLSGAVERSMGLIGTFEAVSASRVVADGLAPEKMTRTGSMVTAWGANVSLRPSSVSSANDAFVVTYPSTPSDVCVRLASAVASSTYDIRVNGNSVFSSGNVDPNRVAEGCSQTSAAQMEFVYHSGLVAGTAVAAPPLVLPPVSPGTTPPVSSPAGQPVGPVGPVGPASPVGPVSSTPPASTPTPVPAVAPGVTPIVPSAPPSSPTPTSTPPPSTVAACVAPANTVENQNVNCGAGQYGTISQSRFATWSCPEAWDAPVRGAFSAWTTTSNSCTTCPAPSTQSQTQWVATTGACPSGQLGSQSWQRQQVSTRSVTYSCPAGTLALPGPTYGAWSGWSDTGATQNFSSSCAPACVLPSPSTETNSETRTVSQTLACPAGQTGSIVQTRQEQRTQTRSAYCPAPTGAPAWGGWSGWSGWNPTTGWATASNSCVSAATYPSRVNSGGGQAAIAGGWDPGNWYVASSSWTQSYPQWPYIAQNWRSGDLGEPMGPATAYNFRRGGSASAGVQACLSALGSFSAQNGASIPGTFPAACSCQNIGNASLAYVTMYPNWTDMAGATLNFIEYACP